MSDIVEWLHGEVPHCDDTNNYDEWELRMLEAADEIDRLREALRYYANKSNWLVLSQDQFVLADGGRVARAALGEGNE